MKIIFTTNDKAVYADLAIDQSFGHLEAWEDFFTQSGIPSDIDLILLQGFSITTHHVLLPQLPHHHRLKAIAYALEDKITESIDDIHLTMGELDAEGYPVALVSRALIESLMQRFTAAQIVPRRLLPSYLALPISLGWTVFYDVENEIADVRTGLNDGFSCPLSQLPYLIDFQVKKQHEQPLVLIVYSEVPLSQEIETSLDLSGVTKSLKVMSRAALYREGLQKMGSLNLLQGKFQRKTQDESSDSWLGVFTKVTFITVLLSGLLSGLSYFVLSREVITLDKNIAAIYFQIFPQAKQVTSPRLRIEQVLRSQSGGSQSHFIRLVDIASQYFKDNRTIHMLSANYDQQALSVEFTIDKFESLDTLEVALKRAGITVERNSATTIDNGVKARLRMTL